MSDNGASQEAVVPVSAPSAGTMLRQAREATGLHIAALSVALKVSVRKLEALEADRFDELPDAVFVRGLASAVCRTLRIDAAPVLARLPQRIEPVLAADPSHQDPFPSREAARLSGAVARANGPAVWAVGALLLGAALMAFLPDLRPWTHEMGWLNPTTPAQVAKPAAPALPVVPAGTGMAVDSVTSMAQTPAEPAPPPAAASASVPIPAPTPTPTPTPTQTPLPIPAVTPIAPPAAVASAAADKVMRFAATAQTWVEVLDRYGAVAYKGMLQPGDSVDVGGRVPLAVTVGRADGVKVQVRGQAFDLAAVSKANVAHFEVK